MGKLTKKQSLAAQRAIEHLITLMGTQQAAADKIGVRAPVLHAWRRGRQLVPCARCPIIERITAGQIRCEDLRPDIEWGVVRGSIAKHDLDNGR